MSLATLLDDFARLLTIEAKRVEPPGDPGEPDHVPRGSRNDRRHMLDTARLVERRLQWADTCDCPTCSEVWQR